MAKDAEREFVAAFENVLLPMSCETFGESNYRGGFKLAFSNKLGSCEVLYSDMQMEVSFNGKEVFGTRVHAGFEGNMFSREQLREYLPRIAASAAAAAQNGRLSKWLMECITSHPELQGLRRWMLATRDAHGLYEKFGFTPLKKPEIFMERHNPSVYDAGA